MPSLVLKHK